MAESDRRTTRVMGWLDPRHILSLPGVYALHSLIVGPEKYKVKFARDILGVKPGERVLDIGCGTGNLFPYMAGADYVGFDGDENYIAEARRKFGDRATFHHRWIDRRAVKGLDKFDLVIASGVLHHLDDQQATALFEAASDALKDGGRLITCDGVYADGQGALRRWIISLDRGEFVRSEPEYNALAKGVFPDVTSSLHKDLVAIPYSHCVMSCRLTPEPT